MAISPRSSQLEEQLQRVREEYRDAPSLHLTPSEVQRLFGLEPWACGEILEALLRENFLCRTSDGVFMRSGKRD